MTIFDSSLVHRPARSSACLPALPVRRGGRVGQRDLLHLGPGQIGERADLVTQLAVNRQDQRSSRIGMNRLGPDQSLTGQVADERLVGR